MSKSSSTSVSRGQPTARSAALFAALSMTLGGTHALAQGQPGATRPSPTSPKKATPASPKKGAPSKKAPDAVVVTTDARLTQFAKVALDIQKVEQKYRPRIQAAKAREQREAILQEANRKMLEIVAGHGFSQEDYMKLSEAVQSDRKVAARFEKLLNKERLARKKAKKKAKKGSKDR